MKQLVDDELFARYDRLLLQSSLDLMADVVYCPRQSCGTAVMVEPDTTMGICSACHYAFCTLCKLGYHGLSGCKIRAGNVSVLSAMDKSPCTAIKMYDSEHSTKFILLRCLFEGKSSYCAHETDFIVTLSLQVKTSSVPVTLFCNTDELRNLRDEYLSATTDGKKFMEQRFGKRVIQKAVEESFSTDWLNENCKCCPRCGTNIQVWLPLLLTVQ